MRRETPDNPDAGYIFVLAGMMMRQMPSMSDFVQILTGSATFQLDFLFRLKSEYKEPSLQKEIIDACEPHFENDRMWNLLSKAKTRALVAFFTSILGSSISALSKRFDDRPNEVIQEFYEEAFWRIISAYKEKALQIPSVRQHIEAKLERL